jgi:hypothetical protein
MDYFGCFILTCDFLVMSVSCLYHTYNIEDHGTVIPLFFSQLILLRSEDFQKKIMGSGWKYSLEVPSEHKQGH